LTLWNASIFVAFFGLAFVLFYFAIRTAMLNDFEQELHEDVEEFRLLLSEDGWQAVISEIDREVLEENPQKVFFRISDSTGNIRYTSDLSLWSELPPIPQLRNTGEEAITMISIVAPDDDYSARVAIGWIGPDSILEIGETTEELFDFLEVLLATFSGTFILVVVFASVAGWLLVRRAMRGVEAVTAAAVDVANGTLNRRVEVATEGLEIERLAATFNLMLERIHTLISGMREMTDNVAHDLRSPLARIRANAEMALSSANTVEEYRHATADTLEECDRLMHLINTTLDVAEAEAGIALHDIQTVDVSQMAEEACELFAPLAEDKHISVETEIQANCRVPGDLQLLQRMLANLLDNAFKYSEPDSRVTVRVQSESDEVCLSVSDSGVGIALEDQSRIFDRFFRCDQSRNQVGCGLGLSLVRAVAGAHRGDVKVSSTPGGGSEFTVVLPA
jgi:heavy metal sensor kinase